MNRLEEIRTRLEQSSSYIRLGSEEDHGAYVVAVVGHAVDHLRLPSLVLTCGMSSSAGPYFYDDPSGHQSEADALFLAHAQRDIAYLLEEMERLENIVGGNW